MARAHCMLCYMQQPAAPREPESSTQRVQHHFTNNDSVYMCQQIQIITDYRKKNHPVFTNYASL